MVTLVTPMTGSAGASVAVGPGSAANEAGGRAPQRIAQTRNLDGEIMGLLRRAAPRCEPSTQADPGGSRGIAGDGPVQLHLQEGVDALEFHDEALDAEGDEGGEFERTALPGAMQERVIVPLPAVEIADERETAMQVVAGPCQKRCGDQAGTPPVAVQKGVERVEEEMRE